MQKTEKTQSREKQKIYKEMNEKKKMDAKENRERGGVE
jgi:hypothetical protein